MSQFAETLTIVSAVGAATAAGTFFAYSTFTMKGLARLSPAQGAAAMQSINKEAPASRLFMLLVFGTGAAFIPLVVYAVGRLDEVASIYRLVAAALYLAGVVVLTGTYHVPRNNRLDGLDPSSPEGVRYWAIYLDQWVRMNHVRTIAPLVASVLLVIALQVE